MPQSSNIHQYTDVRDQLEALLRGGGGKIKFDEYREAVIWRARAYKYRILLRDQQRDPKLPTYNPTTPFDTMIIRLDQKKRIPVCEVVFGREPVGRIEVNNPDAFLPANEAPIDSAGFDPDEALAAAEKMMEEDLKNG